MNRYKAALTCSLVALTATLAACSSSGGPSTSKSSSAPGKPDAASNASATLNVVVPSLSQFLGDPFQAVSQPRAESTSAIFDALTRVSNTGVTTPWLATSWKRLSPTSWQFSLRPGVTFSNGEPMDAAAVVASVKALGTDAGAVAKIFVGDLASATAVNATTVDVTTSAADGLLPSKMAALYIVPPKYLAKVGIAGFSKAPIGTGPYTVSSISTSEIDLKANMKSWRKPMIGNVVIKQVVDTTARTNALLAGQADIDTQLDVDQVDNVKSKGDTVYALQNQAVFALQFVAKTGGPNPLDKVQVRQALNCAVDEGAIIKSVFHGLTTAASQGLPPGTTGYDAAIKPYPYDPAKAKSLLSEAGYPNGLTLTGVYSAGAFAGDADTLQAVQSYLKAVGVNLKLTQTTTTNMTTYLLKASWPAQMFTTAYLTGPVGDATTAYTFNSCIRTPGSWCDPAQAALIAKAATQTLGSSERAATLTQLAELIHNNPPGLFLNNGVKIIGYNNKIGGYKIDSSTNTSWESIYFK